MTINRERANSLFKPEVLSLLKPEVLSLFKPEVHSLTDSTPSSLILVQSYRRIILLFSTISREGWKRMNERMDNLDVHTMVWGKNEKERREMEDTKKRREKSLGERERKCKEEKLLLRDASPSVLSSSFSPQVSRFTLLHISFTWPKVTRNFSSSHPSILSLFFFFFLFMFRVWVFFLSLSLSLTRLDCPDMERRSRHGKKEKVVLLILSHTGTWTGKMLSPFFPSLNQIILSKWQGVNSCHWKRKQWRKLQHGRRWNKLY